MDNDLRALQEQELYILKEFVDLCEKNNLRYYLSEGTLLGAVRHNGFIPWDDDVDVCMPRMDYEQFSVLAQSQLPSFLRLLDYKTAEKNNINLFTVNKLYDTRKCIEWTFNGKCECTHPWIDIMPLDGLPMNKFTRVIQIIRKEFEYKLFRIAQIQRIDTSMEPRATRKIILVLIRMCHIDRWFNTQRRLLVMNKHLEKYSFDDSYYTYNAFSEYTPIIEKSCFGRGQFMQFENYQMRVPEKYEEVLIKEYGDYMKLPPVEDRRPKHKVRFLDRE